MEAGNPTVGISMYQVLFSCTYSGRDGLRPETEFDEIISIPDRQKMRRK